MLYQFGEAEENNYIKFIDYKDDEFYFTQDEKKRKLFNKYFYVGFMKNKEN
jgi:hypothetical protein